jgi:hypothetical protein
MSSKSLIACAPTEIPWVARRLLVHHPAGGIRVASSDFSRPVLSLPHEAWIQSIRAPLALRGFSALPCALKDYAAQDFEDILRALLYQTASANARRARATRPNLRFAGSRTADLAPFCHRERIADPPLMLSVRLIRGIRKRRRMVGPGMAEISGTAILKGVGPSGVSWSLPVFDRR